MSLKDYEILNYLSAALEKARLELDRVKGKTEETINLSTVIVNIEEAKNIARSTDKLLIENFESEIRKISGKRAIKENYGKLERILLHLDAQINMSKAAYDYTDEEYNKFLKLLEIEEIKNYLLSFRTHISDQSFKLISGLNLIAKKDGDKVVLTQRGSYLSKALKSLELLRRERRGD